MRLLIFLIAIILFSFVSCTKMTEDAENLIGTETVRINTQDFIMVNVSGETVIPSLSSNSGDKKISRPFAVNRYETTYELWYDVRSWAVCHGYVLSHLGNEGSYGNCAAPSLRKYMPVTLVNAKDIAVWCNAYSRMCGLEPCFYEDAKFTTEFVNAYSSALYMKYEANGFRILTSAEWEYCFRGGNPSSEAWNHPYSGSGIASDVAVYGIGHSEPCGSKNPNTLGLYDFSGNVWEYCFVFNCDGSTSFCTRGGSWGGEEFSLKYNYHTYANSTDSCQNYIGFRIGRSL